MIRRNQQQGGVYVPRRSSSLAAVLSSNYGIGEQISRMAMDSNNFGSGYAGAWGAVAQGLTAGIGAFAKKKEQDQEIAARQAFAEQFPEHASLASQLSPESRDAINTKILMSAIGGGADQPAKVREWEYFDKLEPSKKKQYLNLHRDIAGEGSVIDNEGSIAVLPGYQRSVAGRAAAAQNAKNQSDLSYALPIKQAEALGAETGKKLAVQKTKEMQAPANLDLLDGAEALLPQASSGTISNIGTKAANFAGISTKKGKADESLKGIAANLVLNVPRMEGPQSDKDTALYKQAAADVANPNIPAESRKAAIDTMKSLQLKYLQGSTQQPQQSQPQQQSFNGFKVLRVRSK